MSQTLFSSDLHEDHKNIGKFRRIPEEFVLEADGDTTKANTLWLNHWWRKLIRPKDHVHLLGDHAFSADGLEEIASRPGIKHSTGGNHDEESIYHYATVFETNMGLQKKYGFWMSHAPIHPDELRGKFNVHGHTHYHQIDDWRYVNVCCDNLMEQIGRPFITLEELRLVMEKRRLSEKVEWL